MERVRIRDRHLDMAVDTIRNMDQAGPVSSVVRYAVAYLDHRIPISEDRARAAFNLLHVGVEVIISRMHDKQHSDDEFKRLVQDPADGLTEAIREWPPLRELRDRLELVELARQIGVSGDWHEPDESEVDVLVTDGKLDNAGWAAVEKQVIIRKDETAVAQVSLATLLAWASTRDR